MNNVLKEFAASNPNLELWWDSSPLQYAGWSRLFNTQFPDEIPIAASDFHNSIFSSATTNPMLVADSLLEDTLLWEPTLIDCAQRVYPRDINAYYWEVYKSIIKKNAEMLLPGWKKSQGRYGWLCAQLLPMHSFNADALITYGAELASIAPNIMIKVVGSREGYEAIEELTSRGIPTNNTLTFLMPQLISYGSALSRGLEKAKQRGVDLAQWRSIFTFMIGRFGQEEELVLQAKQRGEQLTLQEIRWAELAMFKKMYRWIEQSGLPTKMIVCSLKLDGISSKGFPNMHLKHMAGANAIFTLPPSYLTNALKISNTLEYFEADAFSKPIPDTILEKLLALPYFADAYSESCIQPNAYSLHPAFIKGLAFATTGYSKMFEYLKPKYNELTSENVQTIADLTPYMITEIPN